MNKCFIISVSLLVAGANSFAACVSGNPLTAPSKDVMVYAGETPDGMRSFGESPYGRKPAPYPPPPPAGMTSQDRLRTDGNGPLEIWYFEPTPKANSHRVCRVDSWLPRKNLGQAQPLFEEIKQKMSSNILAASLLKRELTLAYSVTYSYDAKGRIEQIEESDLSKGLPIATRAQNCRRYDEKDRVVLWVNPESTRKCPQGDPSPKDEWREFRFGTADGKDVELRSRWHMPKANGRWKEEWAPFQVDAAAGSVHGNAYVDSVRGVTEIFGSDYGRRDNNAANMVVDVFGRWNGSTYYFVKPPIQISVLEKPDEIYKHERRRMTRLDNETRLFELFKPNEHVSRHRFYMLAGFVLRHEQLNEKGKIRRIITVNDWRQPRPGPNPDFDDKLLVAATPKLLAHQVYHRVYDVDANGRPTLVALSWDRSTRNPVKDVPLSAADLVFGTPDGKEKWKTRDEFDKTFDTSEDARQVFPDRPQDNDE